MTEDGNAFKGSSSIVVFGASGDLAKKKTFPALFGLYREEQLEEDVQVIGYARSGMNDEQLKSRLVDNFEDKGRKDKVEKFLEKCSYHQGQYDKPEGFQELNKKLNEFEKVRKVETPQRLFYLALPPTTFSPVCEQIKKNCYPKDGKIRVVIEKPFGEDLESYRQLQKSLAPIFSETELYRIDHYLGKEMVKNIMALRFGNELFNASWDARHIKSIQISLKEAFGTEGRGGYFDSVGIIRDVMQNHLLQVLTLLTMEKPHRHDPEAVRDEKVKVLRAMNPIDIKDILLGQYTRSTDGKKPAYVDDDTVKKDSKCVTYAALGMSIDNDRWRGVPIVLRAGKALDDSKAEIRIQFRETGAGIFDDVPRNELVVRIQPKEAIYMKINGKIPGISAETAVTELDLTYATRYSHEFWVPQAYETLIRDCLLGNHSNFVRDDELDVSWKLFTPLLHYLDSKDAPTPELYPYGSKGPKDLRKFLNAHDYVFYDNGTYQWPLTTPDVKGKI